MGPTKKPPTAKQRPRQNAARKDRSKGQVRSMSKTKKTSTKMDATTVEKIALLCSYMELTTIIKSIKKDLSWILSDCEEALQSGDFIVKDEDGTRYLLGVKYAKQLTVEKVA